MSCGSCLLIPPAVSGVAAPSCDPDIAGGSCMELCGNEGDEGELEGEGTPAIHGKTTKENNDAVARTASKV